MRVSLDWIREYVRLPASATPERIALELTTKTTEVEGVIDMAQDLDKVVVGEVTKLAKHPDADKLTLCTVSDGTSKKQVVCGGSNLRQGMKVAYAQVGSYVRWHGQGEPVKLKKATIRGQESHGMIAAASEIGLEGAFPPQNEREILDISAVDASPGTSLARALGMDDTVLDIDNKSLTHRPDLWGHVGMARELAAIYQAKLSLPDAPIAKIDAKEADLKISVPDHASCPRFMGAVLSGIKIQPSPAWMRSRLQAAGVRPINNVVDVTNYVLLELGQPMHAYDRRTVDGDRLGTRQAKKGEIFVTLDGEKRRLTESDLLIEDGSKAVALAGIMGGRNSEVSDDTAEIVLECANFEPVGIRKTSLRLGLRTESSARFEKGLDPELPAMALNRAIYLLKQVSPRARVVSPLVDMKRFSLDQGPLELPYDHVVRRIGQDIGLDNALGILSRLGFETAASRAKRPVLSVTIPTWRAGGDISMANDLVEEIARIHGYDEIEPALPEIEIAPPAQDPVLELARRARQVLSLEQCFMETYGYSFVSSRQLALFGFDASPQLTLRNPVSEDHAHMRPSLVPNLALAAAEAAKHVGQVRVFEVGKVFEPGGGLPMAPNARKRLPRQDTHLAGIVTGDQPFFAARDAAKRVLARAGLDSVAERSALESAWAHPARGAGILAGQEIVGEAAELHPAVAKSLGLKSRAACFWLNLTRIAQLPRSDARYRPLPAYPEVKLDVSLITDERLEWHELRSAIRAFDTSLIRRVQLFDVYRGKGVPEGKKSLAFHIAYRSDGRTLAMGEVQAVHDKLLAHLARQFKTEVRA